jgi:hypothetical protein
MWTADREPPDAAVADEHVRAAAEYGHGDVVFAGYFRGRDQLFDTFWLEQDVRGATYLPGRVALQRFVELG